LDINPTPIQQKINSLLKDPHMNKSLLLAALLALSVAACSKTEKPAAPAAAPAAAEPAKDSAAAAPAAAEPAKDGAAAAPAAPAAEPAKK
jgi:hypothetical protein